MARPSFGGWRLSSSESDGEPEPHAIKTRSSDIRSGEVDLLDISTGEVEYIPLSERLKRRNGSDKETREHTTDEELPAFSLPKHDTLQVPCVEKENIGSIGLLKCDRRSPTKLVKSGVKSATIAPPSGAILISKPTEEFIRSKRAENSKSTNRTVTKIQKGETGAKTAKDQKKEEAAKRKAMNSHLKMLKPDECMKYMICLISNLIPEMFEGFDFMKELQTDVQPTCMMQYSERPCVTWRRKVLLTDGEQEGVTEMHDEPDMLVVLPASEFVKRVHAQTSHSVDEQTLTNWVKQLRLENPQINIHLVCYGVEKYNRNLKSKQTREAKNQGKVGNPRKRKVGLPDVLPDEIEESLVDLQIECNTTVLYVEKPEELVTMIKQLTKSLGEAPYKRMKRQDVLFINETPSVKVNPKTGEGLKKAWKQMIQQFHNVTPVMSSAIADKYPSLLSLMKAYEDCGSDISEAEALLADIPVRRGVGTIQTSRRIGPELSYKVYKFITSIEPDERLY